MTTSGLPVSIVTEVPGSLTADGWAGATLAASQNDSCDILVVDDDPFIRTTVSEVLADAGYAVGTAENALEAAHAIARTPPKVVLLDIRMPGLDGPGLARDLRARNVQSKILVMTAARNAQRYARELAADGYIEKPFEIDDLRSEVERLMGKQS